MEKYIGKKEVEALPMTMGEAYKRGLLQAGRVPSAEHESDLGYCVRYPGGYMSWSPAKVFEQSYRKAETYRDRMQIEMDELSARISKLGAFMDAKFFQGVVSDSPLGAAFHLQYIVMKHYLALLEYRIVNHDDNDDYLKNMSFSMVIEALKAGRSARREWWNNSWIELYTPNPNGPLVTLVLSRESKSVECWYPTVDDLCATDWIIR